MRNLQPHGARRLVGALLAVLAVCPAGAARAETLRDPFEFGLRAGGTEQAGPVLVGVIWDAVRPLAIVGDETVAAGAFIGDWQVAEIRQDGVVVEQGGQREFIAPGKRLPK